MWTACILTLFPELFPGPLGYILSVQGLNAGRWSLDTMNICDFAGDRHRSVDDTPAGGGAGMVMRADIMGMAIDAALERHPGAPLILFTPRGAPLTQARVRQMSCWDGAILICGRFEGIDQRVIDARQPEEISVGDYVLSGGEPAAMVLIDAVVRLLPGVMGASHSGIEESFEDNLLEYPHYTRPRSWEGREIPEILLSGDHGRIAAWRREQAEAVTRARRPDLIARNRNSMKTQA